ncbi:hypothetical protein [Niveispirillum sp.]|uniref:hypothetical protein n=1 Tax=Niveispirillum sp. TaxID=1917217 RepID=UPI001B6DB357|nr:hypothetical protein [Niveispirillum sp.]MBP7336881.1 hypothetical protein [Niveispirillum sp.]
MTDPRDHPCMAPGCDQWGGHGFAVGKDRPLIWYCGQHKAIGAARTAPAMVEPMAEGAEPVPPSRGQRRLF